MATTRATTATTKAAKIATRSFNQPVFLKVQQQYQALLDYEFKKRLHRKGICEREKIKEMKDYLRYKKFIQNYDQVLFPYHNV